jgi:hypothetical protein
MLVHGLRGRRGRRVGRLRLWRVPLHAHLLQCGAQRLRIGALRAILGFYAVSGWKPIVAPHPRGLTLDFATNHPHWTRQIRDGSPSQPRPEARSLLATP